MDNKEISYYQKNKEKIKANQREYYNNKKSKQIQNKMRSVIILSNVRVIF